MLDLENTGLLESLRRRIKDALAKLRLAGRLCR